MNEESLLEDFIGYIQSSLGSGGSPITPFLKEAGVAVGKPAGEAFAKAVPGAVDSTNALTQALLGRNLVPPIQKEQPREYPGAPLPSADEARGAQYSANKKAVDDLLVALGKEGESDMYVARGDVLAGLKGGGGTFSKAASGTSANHDKNLGISSGKSSPEQRAAQLSLLGIPKEQAQALAMDEDSSAIATQAAMKMFFQSLEDTKLADFGASWGEKQSAGLDQGKALLALLMDPELSPGARAEAVRIIQASLKK